MNSLTGNPLSLRGRQERYNTGNIIWEARTSQRTPLRNRRINFFRAHLVGPRKVMLSILSILAMYKVSNYRFMDILARALKASGKE